MVNDPHTLLYIKKMRLFVCIAVFIIATASLTINNIYKNISFRSLDRRIYWFTQVQQFLYLSPWTTRVCFLFLSFTLAYMTTRGAINKKERRERERRTVTITRYDVWKWFFFWCSFFSLFLPPMFFGIYISARHAGQKERPAVVKDRHATVTFGCI